MCHQCSELCDKVEISHRLDSKISEISSNLNDSVTLRPQDAGIWTLPGFWDVGNSQARASLPVNRHLALQKGRAVPSCAELLRAPSHPEWHERQAEVTVMQKT